MLRLKIRSFIAVTLFSILAFPTLSKADFSLGTAANYAVLASPGSHAVHLSSDSGITSGNMGVLSDNQMTSGSNQNSLQFSSGTVNGNLYLQGSFTGTNTGGTVTGTISSGVTDVGTAYTTVSNLSTFYAGENSTATVLGSGTSAINVESGTKDSAGTYVFTTTANNFSSFANTVTITGSANDYVVINVTGNNNASFSAFTLSGGITSDHVIYNILGVNQNLQVSNGHGGSIYGDILTINDNVNMDNATLYGRIFGGNQNDFSLVSGFHVVQPNTAPTPEPASILMMVLGGGMAAGYRAHRRSRRSKQVVATV